MVGVKEGMIEREMEGGKRARKMRDGGIEGQQERGGWR